MNRRHLLATIPALALAACGTVTSSKTGTVTTVQVNVAKLTAWADAISTAASAILTILSAVPQTAAVAMMVESVQKLVIADIDAINRAAGGQAVLTFDAASPPAAVASLLADGRELVADLTAANLPPGVGGKVAPYVAMIEATETVQATHLSHQRRALTKRATAQ